MLKLAEMKRTGPSSSSFHQRYLPALTLVIALGFFIRPAQANYIVTLEQVGSDLVATGSGAIDLTGLSLLYHGTYGSQVVPDMAFIATGPTGSPADDVYSGAFSGPSFFGSGSFYVRQQWQR